MKPIQNSCISPTGKQVSSEMKPTVAIPLSSSASPLLDFEAFSSSFTASNSPPGNVIPVSSEGETNSNIIGVVVPQPLECLQGTPVPAFLCKTFDLVDDPLLDPVISWGSTGQSFVVWDHVEFSKSIIPRNFKHNNFSSFVRQLNTYVGTTCNQPVMAAVILDLCYSVLGFDQDYGFRKVDADRWEFANEDFLQGQRHLLKNIHRRKSTQGQIGSHVEFSGDTGRFGLEGEIENLKKDRSLLMQEVVRLQQEHRGSAYCMEKMKQRLDAAEQRQKQMISFLARLLQNPVFLARLQKMNEQKEIASPRVKRKFVKHLQVDHSEPDSTVEGRHIVKYGPCVDNKHTSLTMEDLNQMPDRQLSGQLLQDMVERLGLNGKGLHSQVENMARDELEQGFVGASTHMKLCEPWLKPVGYEDTLKGKNVASPQAEVGPDYTVSLPEDLLSKGKIFAEFMSPGEVGIAKKEDIWNMDIGSIGLDTSSHDVFADLDNYDDHELGAMGEFSKLWDLGPHQAAENVGVDKWPADASSCNNLASQAGLPEYDRV
ncbi:hypothetical protein IFM89_029950 [Coptis chinensis]|uniref:HSF-type DNA-binding domain-containing protein n=1 Tax=Coptis chinensis TaxID=261450 RepID=A0A835HDX3_9MAGN|nr:hypothetical protein IFM89_029950 [Coptis chinensis]